VTDRRAAERLKDQLIGTGRHELRTPVTAVAGARPVLARATGAGSVAQRRRRTAAWVDADRATQVITNLVGNAAKFSPSGATITVGAELMAGADRDAGPVVRVYVRDEGRGIGADKLERIFNRFEQVDAADAREKGGAGLGLAICRAIVRQHGGRIWAESAGAGAGSTFYFTLPTAEGALTAK
jgi:signal transduction histidine kinase